NRTLKVETPEQSREMLIGVLKGESGAAQDIVCLNAGVALYAANVAESVPAGLALARAAVASGAALAKLEQLVTRTHALAVAA
ncbi:MAG: anthranilate phosphoribosyltransferase, partial [Gammaproteobacteria bacterium]|nr:anthranilate phosphoribosyltransferase [Gammaproteobacteria bacterium]